MPEAGANALKGERNGLPVLGLTVSISCCVVPAMIKSSQRPLAPMPLAHGVADRPNGVVGGIGPDLRQAAEGDDPDVAAGPGAARSTEPRCSRSCAGTGDQRSNDRPASYRHQDRGG